MLQDAAQVLVVSTLKFVLPVYIIPSIPSHDKYTSVAQVFDKGQRLWQIMIPRRLCHPALAAARMSARRPATYN